MKRLFFFAIAVFIFACNNNKKEVDPTPWLINDATAIKMKKYLRDCVAECEDNTKIVNYNRKIYEAIKKRCNGCTITEVPARYKDKDDEDRYCRLRGLSGDTCKVRGHKTIIYMTVSNVTSGQLSKTEFFDIVSICPPPRECGSTDSSHLQ